MLFTLAAVGFLLFSMKSNNKVENRKIQQRSIRITQNHLNFRSIFPVLERLIGRSLQVIEYVVHVCGN